MPKTNTAQTNHAEPSPPRARRGRGAKATAKKDAKQDRVAKHRQESRRDLTTRTPSKQELCLDLLSRPDGASVEELQAATGWQTHSVRGFLSGTVKKKLGLTVNRHRILTPYRRAKVTPALGCPGSA